MVIQNKNPSVQDQIYAALRDSIINLGLIPGTAVSEKEIALRFNVSRTPVREAFINLSKESLVEVIPQKETRISLIDLNRAEQEFFIREQLENGVLKLFIKKCGEEHFLSLQKLLELQESALAEKAYADFITHDDKFHQTFFEAAGQSLSWDVLTSISGHYHRARILVVHISGIAGEKIRQHRDMVKALRNKDLRTAKKILNAHLYSLLSEEQILKRHFPAYFLPDEKKNTFEVDFKGLPRL